jgi:hypothetical protein
MQEGGAAVFICDASADLNRMEHPVGFVLAADEKDRATLENGGLDAPCLALSLGVTESPETPWRDPEPVVTLALMDRDPLFTRIVCESFIEAFDPTDPVGLIVYSTDPSQYGSALKVAHEPPNRSIALHHLNQMRQDVGGGRLPFDLLLLDANGDHEGPLAMAATVNGRGALIRADTARRSDDWANATTAMDLRSAAKAFLAREPLLPQNSADPGKAAERVDAASWRAKARLLNQIATCVRPKSAQLSGIGWITRWNVMCGIGDHAAHQVAEAGCRNVILAPHEDGLLGPEADNVERCWTIGLSDNGFEPLLETVYREKLAAIVIHFNWAFYQPAALQSLVADLRTAGRVIVIDMHSTISQTAPGLRLADFAECLRLCHRVIVHQPADFERVRAIVPDANVMIEPLAISVGLATTRVRTRSPLIGSFGFCLPNKGIEQLVMATWMLRHMNTEIRLLLLNAEHPAPVSSQTASGIRALIKSLDLVNYVDFFTDFLPESECLDRLSRCSLIVNPYQQTAESSSAAVRYALASGAPVLVTPQPIFDDLGEAVFRCRGARPEDLCDGIRATLSEIEEGSQTSASVAAAAERWRQAHDIGAQTRRLVNLMSTVGLNERLHDWGLFSARA